VIKDLVPTGIEALDEIIGGGFQKGSLILLAGNPGTGKTTFAAQFICKGVEAGEVGVYVSFAEDKDTLIRNMEKFLGRDCEKYVKSGRCKILDMITVKKEGLPAILDLILAETVGAKRLVIDSFSAMAQAFKDPIEVRIILHTILSRIVRQSGCTTLLVCEVPIGEEHAGLGMEEFVADGVILLKASELDGRPFRDLEIRKLRGSPLPEKKMVFTLSGGFKVFQPFKFKPVEKPAKFKPIDDPPGKFSTGIPDLDRLLDGGYPRSATVLFEIDEQITTPQYHLIVSPTAWNFGAKGRGTIVIPSMGMDYKVALEEAKKGGFTEDVIDNLLRVPSFEFMEALERPSIIRVKGENLREDSQKIFDEAYELIRKTGKPTLSILGVDRVASYYREEEVLKAINIGVTITRVNKSLLMLLLKPSYPKLGKILRALADIHLKLTREHGVLILYGIKPRTCLYVVEMDVSQGYPLAKLTPIT